MYVHTLLGTQQIVQIYLYHIGIFFVSDVRFVVRVLIIFVYHWPSNLISNNPSTQMLLIALVSFNPFEQFVRFLQLLYYGGVYQNGIAYNINIKNSDF